MLSKFH